MIPWVTSFPAVQALQTQSNLGSLCVELKSTLNIQCTPPGSDWRKLPASNVTLITTQHKEANLKSGKVRKILILSPKISAAYNTSSTTLVGELTQRDIAEYQLVFFNYMGNTKNAEDAIKLAENNAFDLIISMGSPTTKLLSKKYRYGSIPVVTACSKDPVSMGLITSERENQSTNIAYTSLNISVATQVSYIQEKYFTQLKRIAVIYDKNNQSSIITQVTPLKNHLNNNVKSIQFYPIEVDFNHLKTSLYSKLEKIAHNTEKMGDSVFLITGSTELFNIIKDINRFAGQVPVLSVTPSHVSRGEDSVFMAIGVSFETNARLAADYAYRILNNKTKPSALKIGIVSTPDISISFMHKPVSTLKVPLSLFEDAGVIYDYQGNPARLHYKKEN